MAKLSIQDLHLDGHRLFTRVDFNGPLDDDGRVTDDTRIRETRPTLEYALRKGARLINLSSSGHRYSNVDLQDPNFECTPYEPFVAYGRSKTANLLFAVAFDKRHRGRGVRAAAVHPGGIQTELGATQTQAAWKR